MSRRAWPGVAVGLVAAAAGLVGCGASQQRTAPLVIDESAGRVGQIAVGEALADVISRAGPPDEDSRFSVFAPAGKLPSDIGANGGFFSTPAGPRGAWPEIFRYKHLAALFVQDRVFAMVTDDAGARTRAGVGIGDPLSAVRAVYRKTAKCILESSGGEFRSPAHCAVSVPAGHLSFGDDPIKSIELIAGTRYTGGSPHAVCLRHRDSAIFAGVKCTASSKGGTEHLLCQRQPKDGYEVAIFQDTILVYKAGNPEPIFVAPHK